MKPATLIRLALILAVVVALEIACRMGAISRFTLVPPSQMVIGLWAILMSGRYNQEIALTFGGIAIAAVASIVIGFLIGATLHALPRARRALDPYLASYYAVPIFVFYPLFIVVFGFNRIPIIFIGFLFALVAMITNTLNGLDRVPRVLLKTAQVLRMSRPVTIREIVLPSAFPAFLAGAKFAFAYSFVGVIGAEFILASQGIGYRIAFAFNDFDNVTMYALIVLVLAVVGVVNAGLSAWERRVLGRRGLS